MMDREKIDRETRLRVTVMQLTSMVEALEHLNETVLPKNPKQYWFESQAPLEIVSQLTRELREILGIAVDDRSARIQSVPSAVVEPIPGVEIPPPAAARKE